MTRRDRCYIACHILQFLLVTGVAVAILWMTLLRQEQQKGMHFFIYFTAWQCYNGQQCFCAAKCVISPSVASEENTYDSTYPAASTLVDGGEVDKKLPNGTYTAWIGKYKKAASFVIDLGCKTRVTQVHLRNAGANRSVSHFKFGSCVTAMCFHDSFWPK